MFSLVASFSKVGSQQERRNIGEFRDHEFHNCSGVYLSTVEVEDRNLAIDKRLQILVSDLPGRIASLFQGLGQSADKFSLRLSFNRCGQRRVTDQVLSVEQLTSEVD